ncbi:MAG: glycosyltransferase family 39 protein [Deltaproteobacteria bacterium]|nr:glycosyltransferase family 39 protein [Deltaproteobacteria bacterium]
MAPQRYASRRPRERAGDDRCAHPRVIRGAEWTGAALRAVDGHIAAVFGASTAVTWRAVLTLTAVLALGAGLMLYRLGTAEICEHNEAVEAVFVQRMVDHGEWFFPLLNAHEPMYKPPLFHWTAAGLAAGLGVESTTPLVVRLPSALYGLAGIAMAMLLMLRWLGLHSALLSGLMLLGSYQYMSAARFGRVDMALTCCEALALVAFVGWLSVPPTGTTRGGRRLAWQYLCAVGLGLAVLAKGPVGMLIPLLAMGIFLIVDGSWRHAIAGLSRGPALVLIVVSVSWYGLCLASGHSDFLQRQLGSENAARAIGGLGAMPPWYYLRPLLFNSPPLSVLVPIAVVAALRQPRTRVATERVAPKLFAIFWVVTLAVFSLVAYKRRAYLLPLWPPAAMLLAWWLCGAAAPQRRAIWRGAFTLAVGGQIVFNALYLPHADVRYCGGKPARRAAARIQQVVPATSTLYWYGPGALPPPILFYLDRTVPRLAGKLDDAPPGYILVATDSWQPGDALRTVLRPVLTVGAPPHALSLLYRAPG